MSDIEHDGDEDIEHDGDDDIEHDGDEDIEHDEDHDDHDGADRDSADDGADARTAKAVLEYVVAALVDEKDAVRVDVDDSRRTVQLEVRVGPDDMGRVIGRRGRVANAIRTLTRAAAARDGVEVDVEFVD